MLYKILVVEDDNEINNLLSDILRAKGYEVLQAYSGSEAKFYFATEIFSLLLLDLMLPGISGEELIAIFREHYNAPIIILSAKQSTDSKVLALELGADDYMTKPFEEKELVARVESNLRRYTSLNTPQNVILQYKDILLDAGARTVQIDGQKVNLTGREFDILKLLLSSPKRVFTKANIYNSVWNDEFLGDDKTLNVHISNIRTKLGKPHYIQTVWGVGFRLAE